MNRIWVIAVGVAAFGRPPRKPLNDNPMQRRSSYSVGFVHKACGNTDVDWVLARSSYARRLTMSRFMVLTHDTPRDDQPSLAETKRLVEGHSAFAQRLRAVSALVDAERFRPVAEGKRVANRNDQLRVEDGPFDEPPLTGYYVVEAPTLDGAVKLVAECPLPPGGELDIRPLVDGNLGPDKSSVQGHVFGFGVLGKAATEHGWNDVMAQIAATSSVDFGTANVLGGVRLESPKQGKRVRAMPGGHRAVFDGPFLESKEVIGGFFFMRMPSMGDAVRFVGQTAFVKVGTVEIRVLWRT